jgi:hypothetical protein
MPAYRRTYRIVPTVCAVVVFLALGSLGVRLFQSKPKAPTPQQEVQAVYYAMAWTEEAPGAFTTSDLRPILAQLDPGLIGIADRVTVVSYVKQKGGWQMEVRHSAQPGKTWTITPYGLR